MKNNYLTLIRLLTFNILGLSSFSHADDLISNPFPFTLEGVVTFTTCGVHESTEHKYIDLGTNAVKQIKVLGDKTLSKNIYFDLIDCPPNTEVYITLEGPSDPNDPELLAINKTSNSAKNIAIEIQDENRKRSPINSMNTFMSDNDGKLSTIFYAHYTSVGGAATAGVANSRATFKIDYH